MFLISASNAAKTVDKNIQTNEKPAKDVVKYNMYWKLANYAVKEIKKNEKPAKKPTKYVVKEMKPYGKPSSSSTTVSSKRVIPTSYEWYFLDINNKWIKYGSKDSSRNGTRAGIASENIENLYQNNEFGELNFSTERFHYILKFYSMEQMNVTTKKVRPVHRRPVKKLGRETIVNDKYLSYPTASKHTVSFINMELNIGTFKVLADVGKVVDSTNKEELKDGESVGKKVNYITYTKESKDQERIVIKDLSKHEPILWVHPSFWDPMKADETLVVVTLLPTSQEYKDVMSHFAANSVIANTVVIKRVQNPYILMPYKIRKNELSIIYGAATPLTVQKLFHGTKEEHVINICKENFDFRLYGTNGRMSFGRGTYFSNSAQLSKQYTVPNAQGHRFMFLADVIVGTIAQGHHGLTRPPRNLVTGELCDTTVDSVDYPQKFVKYDKRDYYPSYIIEFW